MNYTDRQVLTEDVPLRQGRSKGFKFRCYEDGGLKITVLSFSILSIAITVALGLQIIYSDNVSAGQRHGAVATDSKDCSEIGTSILRKGGNAIDAAIAATICMTVVSPHKTGLGGGGYAMIYSHEDRTNPVIIDFARNTVAGAFGSTNVRLPAVLKGLALAHSLHGNILWEQLVSPSVKLAQQGFIVSNEFAQEVEKNVKFNKLYGQLEAGQNLMLKILSESLDVIAKLGVNELYSGSLSQKFVDGSSEIKRELANYEPQIKRASSINFYDSLVYYPPDSNELENALKMIDALRIPYENASTVESEIFLADVLIRNKYSEPGSGGIGEKFSSVIAMDGLDSYVVIITGLSAPFGLGRMTSAGFLMDSAASDLEKLTPVLFCDAVSVCGLRGVIGTDDVTLTAEVLYNLVVRKLNVSAAVEIPRYYIMPDGISIESVHPYEMDPILRDRLIKKLNASHQSASQLLKSCNAIVKIKDTMNSHSDSRGGGLASRF